MSKKIEKAKEILEGTEDNLKIDYPHKRGRKLGKASKLFKEAGKDKKARQLDWEAQIFYAPTDDEQESSSQGERFTTLQKLIENLPSKAFDYLKERSQETKNPIHKARFNDFLWDSEADQAYIYAERAVKAYLDCVPIYLENEQYIRMNDALLRSATLSNHLNNNELQRKTIKVSFNCLETFIGKNQYGKTINPIKAILKLENQLKEEDLKKIAKYAENGADYLRENNDYMAQRMLLNILIKVEKLLENEEKTRRFQEKIVDSFLKEANAKKEDEQYNPGVAATFIQDALGAAQKFQLSDRIPTLKKKVRKANKNLAKKLPKVSVEGELPTESIDQYTKELLDKPIEEALDTIAKDNFLVFDYETSKQGSDELNEDFVNRQLLSRNYVGKTGTFSKPLSEDEKEDILAMRDFCRNIQIQGLLLMRMFSRLQDEGEFDKESMKEFLSKWELMTPTDFTFLKHGIESYFERDYISTIHILVPRIENLIRHLFELNNYDTSHFQRNYKGEITWMSEKTLNQLFGEPGDGDEEAKALFGEQLYHYFYAILLSKNCFNLRNDVAHGFLKPQLCNKNIAGLVIHLLLLLTRFEIEPIENTDKE